MKLLENPKFDALNSALCQSTPECRLESRIESYSCKMVQHDKKLFRSLKQDGDPHELQALSPPQSVLSNSPSRFYGRSLSSQSDEGGYLCDTISKKTLCHLIAALNVSFSPDYDFSDARSEEFSREPSLQWVARDVDARLSGALGYTYSNFKSEMWASIDESIAFSDCDIYSYSPDFASDPFGEEGCIWSFNYFFYNKKLKRIVLFACRASSASSTPHNCYGDEVEDDEDFNMD